MTSAGWFLVAIVALVALVVGFLLGRRLRGAPAAVPARPVDRRRSSPPPLSAEAERLLEHHPTGVVIADAAGAERYRNAAARSFDGSHAGALIDRVLAQQLARAGARTPGETVDAEDVELYGPPAQVIRITATRLSDVDGPEPTGDTEPHGEANRRSDRDLYVGRSGDDRAGAGAEAGGAAIAFVQDVSDAHRLERVRTDFVANVSHELKTPVGALGLLVDALTGEEDVATRERLLARMESETDRAGRMIARLTELSTIESSAPADREPLRLDSIVEAATERVSERARHRGIQVRHRFETNQPLLVVGNREQLESALSNLIDNAVVYSSADQAVDVVIAAGHAPEGSVGAAPAAALVSVIDRGAGIPRDHLSRIFERFYRVDPARSRETGGTGLGLSIVRQAALAHGGSIDVESIVGEGSTFTLCLPAVAQTAVDTPEASQASDATTLPAK